MAETRRTEVHERVSEYLSEGARLVRVAGPRRRVHVFPDHAGYQAPAGGTLPGDEVLPGLPLPVSALFED